MPEWLITILVGAVGAFIAIIIKYVWDNHFITNRQKINNQDHLKQINLIHQEINQPLDEINVNIQSISKKLDQITHSQTLLLREAMKKLYIQCENKQSADDADMKSWFDMFQAYENLGGNDHKLMINIWKEDMTHFHELYIHDKKGE